MKIILELQSETLVQLRAELESFLTPASTATMLALEPAAGDVLAATPPAATPAPVLAAVSSAPKRRGRLAASPASSRREPGNAVPELSAADIALEDAPADTAGKHSAPTPPVMEISAVSAADIAFGPDPGVEEQESDENADSSSENAEPATVDTPSVTSDAEVLLSERAQLLFDFDRVSSGHGRNAALGIVRGVMPHGTKTKLKEIEMLPVELIPAAIAALQAVLTR
jgi:hypothetical protein